METNVLDLHVNVNTSWLIRYEFLRLLAFGYVVKHLNPVLFFSFTVDHGLVDEA